MRELMDGIGDGIFTCQPIPAFERCRIPRQGAVLCCAGFTVLSALGAGKAEVG